MKNNRPWSGVYKRPASSHSSTDFNGLCSYNQKLNDKWNISNNTNSFKNLNEEFILDFKKKKVNIEDLIEIHNTYKRKDYSKGKVKNINFRQNIKLKNKHLYTPAIKFRNNSINPFTKVKNVELKLMGDY